MKRVLELGCGPRPATVRLGREGARAILVDPSADRLADVRRDAERADVKVELHQADLADLAFLRADTIDAALGGSELANDDDIGRVFRQAHRVLRPESPLVIVFPHPAAVVTEGDRNYFDRGDGHRTLEDLFTELTRAGFRVDTLLEPEGGGRVPSTLILRGRKQGI